MSEFTISSRLREAAIEAGVTAGGNTGCHCNITIHEAFMAADLINKLAAERDWQPIATAPKDETQILIWWEGDEFMNIGYWEDGKHGGWHSTEGERFESPTHWQPLPAPPETTADE